MAGVTHTGEGLVGPKSENVDFSKVLKAFLKAQGSDGYSTEEFQSDEPDRLGGGRGRVNPPPRRLVWRFWEVWRVCCVVSASTRLEARGLGGQVKNRAIENLV